LAGDQRQTIGLSPVIVEVFRFEWSRLLVCVYDIIVFS